MKKYLLIISLLLVASVSNADVLDNVSGKISKFAADLIPGEGVTEVSIDIEKNSEPSFNILAVRDIDKTENTNFFTQISFSNRDVSSHERYIGNIGLGYRFLTDDKSMMIGFNSFYDHDLHYGHKRASIGFEASASTLDFNFNQYYALSGMQEVLQRGQDTATEEQSLGGVDYRLASQLPYMPWAEISWKGYQIESDKATDNVKGDIYSLGLALTPSLQLDLSKDQSTSGAEDVQGGKLSFIYPPRESKPTLLDGFSDEVWFEESMQNKLSQKVERNNNLTVEIQGAVIFTKK
jgi:hypothetical protein